MSREKTFRFPQGVACSRMAQFGTGTQRSGSVPHTNAIGNIPVSRRWHTLTWSHVAVYEAAPLSLAASRLTMPITSARSSSDRDARLSAISIA